MKTTVSVITRQLAEAVIAARPACTPRQRLLLELLRLLPLYRDVGNMAIWDGAIHEAMPAQDDTSETGLLIEAIVDFAMFPFYGAFQADETLRDYESTCEYLRNAGIACPPVAEFTDL